MEYAGHQVPIVDGEALPGRPATARRSAASWVHEVVAGWQETGTLWCGREIGTSELLALLENRQEELGRSGIGPRSAVLVALGDVVDLVVTLLASWRLSAQVVLVDHRLPP